MRARLSVLTGRKDLKYEEYGCNHSAMDILAAFLPQMAPSSQAKGQPLDPCCDAVPAAKGIIVRRGPHWTGHDNT